MWRTACVYMCVSVFISAATAAEFPDFLVTRSPDHRPSLLVLAMSHLHNPGQDAANVMNADVLAPRRQKELADFVQQLASYQPTHIAIEHSADEQSKIDAQYADYRADRYELSRDEQDQIGFRLAKLLGLPKVHAVDWTGLPPGDRAAYDWNGFAVRSG